MIETSCVFTHKGNAFEAGGAYILDDVAVVYLNEKARMVTDWHGNVLGYIVTHKIGQRRFSMQTSWRMAYAKVTLDVGGVWWGRYNYDGGNVVKLRKAKS